jgi:DNA polymerase-3 subunit gamma/tau
MLDEVHQLTKEAFNALLKTLEEPPAHIKFILGTTDPQKVPVTVLSRCLQFNLRQMASTTIAEYLQNVLNQENISFEPAAIHLVSRAAAGSMRDALSLTDQAIAYGNQSVNEAEVRSMLGAIDQTYLFEIIHALLAQDGASLIEKAKQMEARSISFEAALNDLANLLHQIVMAQTVPSSIATDLPERMQLLDLAQKLSPETLQLYYQITLLGRRDIGLAPDEYAGFTMTLLRMLAFAPTEKIAENATAKSASNSQVVIESTVQAKPAEPKRIESEQIKPVENDAPEGKTHTASSLINFDGNWRNLVENNLKLGLARALAQNCELLSYDENSLTLRVAENQKHLVSANYQDKLSASINDYFGRKIRLNFEVNAEANTPAKQSANEKATIQSGAEAAIMQDSFVQALINDLGAQIIPNSIKPN